MTIMTIMTIMSIVSIVSTQVASRLHHLQLEGRAT